MRNGGWVRAVSSQRRYDLCRVDNFRNSDVDRWSRLDYCARAISDGNRSWLRDMIRFSVVCECGRLRAVSGQLRDNFSGVARAGVVRNRVGDSSRTVDHSDSLLMGDCLRDMLCDCLWRLCRRRRTNHRFGHRAWAVGNSEHRGLSNRVCFVVLDDCSRTRAVGDQLSDDLRSVVDALMAAGTGAIVIARMGRCGTGEEQEAQEGYRDMGSHHGDRTRRIKVSEDFQRTGRSCVRLLISFWSVSPHLYRFLGILIQRGRAAIFIVRTACMAQPQIGQREFVTIENNLTASGTSVMRLVEGVSRKASDRLESRPRGVAVLPGTRTRILRAFQYDAFAGKRC